jgi:hypothetical protein
VGPFKVIAAYNDSSNVTIELLEDLQKHRVHLNFHLSLIRPFVANDDNQFPKRDTKVVYDLGDDPNMEWHVDEIIGHQWGDQNRLELRVQWTLGDVTWEPLQNCNELEALDKYLELHGVKRPQDLPQ